MSLIAKIQELSTRIATECKSLWTAVAEKQAVLVSGTTIKTINTQSILGSGDIAISGGGASVAIDDVAPAGTETLWYQPSTGTFSIKVDGQWVRASRDGLDGNDGLGWSGASYNPATGVITFFSDNGLGFSTGDIRTVPADGSVTYEKMADTLKQKSIDNDGAWDFSASGIIEAAISSHTTVTFSNFQLNKTLKIKLTVSNSATLVFPSYCKKLKGSIDPSGTNGIYYAYFDCWDSGLGTEEILMSVTQEDL